MKRSVCTVFDIDDTLYLERDYIRSGFEAVGRWVANWVEIQNFAELCWNRFEAGQRRSIFDDVLRQGGREPVPELISALVELYRTHTPSIFIAPDASEALLAICRTSSVAVITDGPATSQSRKVEALRLDEFASPIVLTEMMGSKFRKPHPKAFEHVTRCRPASIYVYVADNPLKDFAAPKHLAWFTIRVRRPGGLHYTTESTESTPDLVMDDCSALPEVLAQL